MTRIVTREELRRIGTVLADAAQVEVMPRFRRLSPEAINRKSSPRDLVTDADEAAERFIIAKLTKLYPGAIMVGEESAARNPALLNMLVDADLAFLIDPIGGTRNFVAGLPLFGMMIAICHRGDVLAGVIYDPITHDWSMAIRGEGAWSEAADGTQTLLKVAQPAPPEEMDGMIVTAYLPDALRQTVNSNLGALGATASLRSVAHEYRLAASGHCHIMLYNRLDPWEHAAGWLLHREAGGFSAHFDASPYKPTHRSGGLLYAPDVGSWHATRRALFGDDFPS